MGRPQENLMVLKPVWVILSVHPETGNFEAAAFKKMMISQKVGEENSCTLQEEEK